MQLTFEEWGNDSPEVDAFTKWRSAVSNVISSGGIAFGSVDSTWLQSAPFATYTMSKTPDVRKNQISSFSHLPMLRDSLIKRGSDVYITYNYFQAVDIHRKVGGSTPVYFDLALPETVLSDFWKSTDSTSLTMASYDGCVAVIPNSVSNMKFQTGQDLISYLATCHENIPVVNGKFPCVVFCTSEPSFQIPIVTYVVYNGKNLSQLIDFAKTTYQMPLFFQRIPKNKLESNKLLHAAVRIFRRNNVKSCLLVNPNTSLTSENRRKLRHIVPEYTVRPVSFLIRDREVLRGTMTFYLYWDEMTSPMIEDAVREFSLWVDGACAGDIHASLELRRCWHKLSHFAMNVTTTGGITLPFLWEREVAKNISQGMKIEVQIEEVSRGVPPVMAVRMADLLLNQTPFRLVILGLKAVGKSTIVRLLTEDDNLPMSSLDVDDKFEADERLPELYQSLRAQFNGDPSKSMEIISMMNAMFTDLNEWVVEEFNPLYDDRTKICFIQANVPLQVQSISQRCRQVIYMTPFDSNELIELRGIVMGLPPETIQDEQNLSNYFSAHLSGHELAIRSYGGAILWAIKTSLDVVNKINAVSE
jgi:hypothetical protein